MSYSKQYSAQSRRKVVGITSRSAESNFDWLVDFLHEQFHDHISEVNILPITNSNRSQWERDIQTCSAAILYHSKHQGRTNITDVGGALYNEELQYMNTTLGRQKVLVVLDDMKDYGEEERERLLTSQPSLGRLSSQLILIPESNKHEAASDRMREFRSVLTQDTRTAQYSGTYSSDTEHSRCSSTHVTGQRENKKQSAFSFLWGFLPSSPVSRPQFRINIFSRSSEINYTWLVNRLKLEGGMESADIKAVAITNHYSEFSREVTQCQFAILYHTLKQGRINITDVKDSLYDEELQDLSNLLGKENIIVVADDLKSDDHEQKDRILKHQPSIIKHAQELFVFAEKQKSLTNFTELVRRIQTCLKKQHPHEAYSHNQQSTKHSVNNKASGSGNELAVKQYGSPVDKGQGLPSKPSTSTSRFGSSQRTSSCQEKYEEEPKPKKIILETSEDTLKEVWDDLSEKLNRNLANFEEVNKKIDNMQLTVQQMQQKMLAQEEQLKHMEKLIEDKLNLKINQEEELRNRADEIMKQNTELTQKIDHLQSTVEQMQQMQTNQEEHFKGMMDTLNTREKQPQNRETETGCCNMQENTIKCCVSLQDKVEHLGEGDAGSLDVEEKMMDYTTEDAVQGEEGEKQETKAHTEGMATRSKQQAPKSKRKGTRKSNCAL